MLGFLLIACTSAERELAIEAEAVSEPEVWAPSSEDTGEFIDPWDSQNPVACGSRNSESEDSETNALSPSFCIRLSPEPGSDEEEKTDSSDTGYPFEDTGVLFQERTDSGGVPPPCGYYNLLGSIAVQGTPETPALMYCDTDIPGGLRFVQVNGETEEVHTQMLASKTCYADPDTGAMFPLEDGWLVTWIDLQAGPGIVSGHISAQGEWSEETSQVLFEGTAKRLHAVGQHLLIVDSDDQLWSIPVDDGVIAGEPLLILDDTLTVGATETPNGFAVATCGDGGGGPHATTNGPLVTLVQNGEIAWTTTLEGDCFFDARPSIAWESNQLAVAWEQEQTGTAIFLDDTGTQVALVDLGEEGRYPQVTALDSGFLLADGSGQVRKMEVDGTPVDTWEHPDLANLEGNIVGLRLTATEDVWGFTLIGNDVEFTQAGHANTFYYLEVSAIPVP